MSWHLWKMNFMKLADILVTFATNKTSKVKKIANKMCILFANTWGKQHLCYLLFYNFSGGFSLNFYTYFALIMSHIQSLQNMIQLLIPKSLLFFLKVGGMKLWMRTGTIMWPQTTSFSTMYDVTHAVKMRLFFAHGLKWVSDIHY